MKKRQEIQQEINNLNQQLRQHQIVEAVISVLERTPPELSADILDRGIMLTGGGSMLRGMEELIEEKTGINTMTADDPMKVVAIGTGEYVEFMGDRKGI